MAITAGTELQYAIIGKKEDVSDVVHQISPEDTPFQSMIGRDKCKNILFQWQTDDLAAAGANAVVEGDEASYTDPAKTVMVANQTQISRKTVSTSGTVEAISLYGRRSEEALQTAKRAAELKRDIEFVLMQNTAGNVGDATTARLLAALPVWIKTNDSIAADGASSTYTTGMPAVARTDGTARALTKVLVDAVTKLVWTQGGKPAVLMVGPFNRTVVSNFTGIATHVVDVTKPQPLFVIDTVDVLVNDFGKLRVVINRYQRERDAYILDPSLLQMVYLRPYFTKPLAPNGDATKKMLIVEYSLKVKQEKGLGMVADLTDA
jgi:hypothetical protein